MVRLLFLIFLFLPQIGFAKIFQTHFLKLDLPANWICEKQELRWTCMDQSTHSSAAVIVISAKQAASHETLESFRQILSRPKPLPSEEGAPSFSEVKKTTSQNINGQNWVNSLHSASELENYMTHYLATRKSQLALLVTLSAHKDYYPKYLPLFNQIIHSFEITAHEEILNPQNHLAVTPDTAPTSTTMGSSQTFQDIQPLEQNLISKIKNNPKYMALAALIALLILGLGFYAMKSR